MKNKLLAGVTMVLVALPAFSAADQEHNAAIDGAYTLTTRSMLTGQVKKPGTVLSVSRLACPEAFEQASF